PADIACPSCGAGEDTIFHEDMCWISEAGGYRVATSPVVIAVLEDRAKADGEGVAAAKVQDAASAIAAAVCVVADGAINDRQVTIQTGNGSASAAPDILRKGAVPN